jgi:NAD(P)-dependent dehydrogenase (short-subunit alcohol dehydrogenase family)
MPHSSSNPTILITGATSGIGRHAALDLARRGHRVFAAGRSAEALDALAAEGLPSLTPLTLDVTSPASIAAAVRLVDQATAGRGVDVLINNAGFGDFAPLELVSDAELRAIYETNVFGLMAVTRAFLPAMRVRGAGRIVNVSSIGGRFTMPLFGAYNSTKYAVEALSDALRMELWPFGIRVSLLEPGAIRTDFTGRALGRADGRPVDDGTYGRVVDRYLALARRMDLLAPGPAVTTRALRHAA